MPRIPGKYLRSAGIINGSISDEEWPNKNQFIVAFVFIAH